MTYDNNYLGTVPSLNRIITHLIIKITISSLVIGLKKSYFPLICLPIGQFVYGLETVVSVLFSNTRTRLLYDEREIFNTARSEAECSIENFEFIVQ